MVENEYPVSQTYKNAEEKILKGVEYKGAETDRFLYTASMRSNDPFQNALRVLIKKRQKQKHIGMNTIGSLMHKGLEDVVSYTDNTVLRVEKEKRLSTTFHINDEDWLFSGSVDVNVAEDNNTTIDENIIDYKLISNFQLEKIKEHPEQEGKKYIPQLEGLAFLSHFKKEKEYQDEMVYHLINFFFSRDAFFAKNQQIFYKKRWKVLLPSDFTIIEEDIKKEISIISETMKDLNGKSCTDLWWRKIDSVSVPTKCTWYCDVKDSCPFYKEGITPVAKKIGEMAVLAQRGM